MNRISVPIGPFDKSALNSIAAQIAVLDRQGFIVAVNNAWRRFAEENQGSSATTEGVGLNYLQVCQGASGPSSEQAKTCREGLIAVLRGDISEFEMEYPCHSPTQERWFSLRAVPWLAEGGGLIVSHIDISAQKKMEEALRRSEERFRVLVGCIEDYAIFMLDADGKIASWNEGAEHIYGYREKEIVGQDYSRLFVPQDIQAGKPQQELNMAKFGEPSSHEQWQQRRDNEPFWANCAIQSMRNAEGNLLGFSTIARDLTERRRAEAMNERAHQQSVSIAELGQQALASTDLAFLMENIAKRITAVLDVEYCQILELLPDNHRLLLRAGIGWQEGRVGRVRIPSAKQSHAGYTLLTNEPVIVEDFRQETRFTGSSLLQEHGVVSGVSVIIHGQQRPFGVLAVHSKRQRTFTQDNVHFLQAAANVLATAIERKRNEELLIQAQKLQAVGQLTGGVAHDFNNMLTIIIGNLQIIESKIQNDPLLGKFIQAALEGARSGAELVNKLLVFSRRQSLQPIAVDLNYQIGNMISMLRRTLGENVEIEMLPGSDLWQAFADPSQIETALLNLAINARDAMPEGGKLIIETDNVLLGEEYAAQEAELKPGQYVMLAVSDTGTGMPPETLNRVFEPFFTTKQAGKGSGLGLSMIYGFAKQSGGHIKIYSEPGYGTTVRLYLPQAGATSKKSRAARETPAAPQPGHGETVLVVEDEVGVRELAVKFLTEAGYRVLEAGDGQTALSLFREGSVPDLLFVDLVLPGGMSGPELARAVQARYSNCRLLFSSGYTKNNVIALTQAISQNVPLLSKPYGKEELMHKVREVLNKRSQPS